MMRGLVKIAIISDVHGNYEALRALPGDYDELWVLGDLVNYGPEPKEVVEMVKAKASVVVRGNHDQSIGYDEDPRCTPRYHNMAEATRRYTASVVTEKHKEFLRNLPLQSEVRRGSMRFYLTHARPSDPLYGYCAQDSDEWVKEVESVAADIVLVGHTHTPFVRQIGNQLLVNPGSLGQPKTGKPDACYAVWQDGKFDLKSFSYPVEKTIAKLKALSFPPEIEKDLITVLQTGFA
jgi:putative phosphoesterase